MAVEGTGVIVRTRGGEEKERRMNRNHAMGIRASLEELRRPIPQKVNNNNNKTNTIIGALTRDTRIEVCSACKTEWGHDVVSGLRGEHAADFKPFDYGRGKTGMVGSKKCCATIRFRKSEEFPNRILNSL